MSSDVNENANQDNLLSNLFKWLDSMWAAKYQKISDILFENNVHEARRNKWYLQR